MVRAEHARSQASPQDLMERRDGLNPTEGVRVPEKGPPPELLVTQGLRSIITNSAERWMDRV